MKASAVWEGEDMTVQFSATICREDIGAEQTCLVDTVEDIEIEDVAVWGVPLPLNTIPAKLREMLMREAQHLEFDA